MDVSIIIVSYNTCRLLKDCLRSVLEKTSGITFELIVVDNASGDGSVQMVERDFPAVKVIALQENVGFGSANNRGIAIASGRNILFLNPDTLLKNNAIRILSDYLDRHPEAGACGGNLYDAEDRPTQSFLRILPGIRSELDLISLTMLSRLCGGKNHHFNYTSRPLKVGRVSGADMMMPRSVIDRVGGFDEDFFLYCEETELSYRIRKAGYTIFSVPSAQITHLEGKSCAYNELRTKWGLISRRLYLEKKYRRKWMIRVCDGLRVVACLNFMLVCRLLGRKELYKSWAYQLKHLFRVKELTYH